MANDRLSQQPVEVVVGPTSAKARTTQQPAEVVVSPTAQKARVTQQPAEVVVSPTSAKARLSSQPVEVVIQTFVPVEVLLDAVLLRPWSASFTLDAVILVPSFTLDASLFVFVPPEEAFDSSAFQNDAFQVGPPENLGFTLDAVVLDTLEGSGTLDAILRIEQAGSLTLDAVLVATATAAFTFDAVILATQTGSGTLDAVILSEQTGAFTLDAVVAAAGATTFTLDAVLQATQGATATLDAVLQTTPTATFTLDGFLTSTIAGSFTLDAVIKREQTGTYTLDAVIYNPGTPTGSFTFDAILGRVVWDDTFTRTVSDGWGAPYTFRSTQYLAADIEVNGSEGIVDTNKDAGFFGFPFIWSGVIQFDAFIPASTTNTRFYVSHESANPAPGYKAWGFEIYPNGNGTYDIGVYVNSSASGYATFTPTSSTWYRFKVYASGTSGGWWGVRVWKRADPEPTTWNGEWQLTPISGAWSPSGLYLSAPSAQTFRFDNLWVLSTLQTFEVTNGFTLNAVFSRTVFTLNAVIGARTFTLNALISRSLTGSFSIDAAIEELGRHQHSRGNEAHLGVDLDTIILIAGAIGLQPVNSTLHEVLIEIEQRITDLENG